MDFELTAEQRLLRDTIRKFTDEQIRPVAREMEAEGAYPDGIVETMRGLGLFGLCVPEEFGGMGADMVSLALVFEEISRGWMGVAGIIGSHSLSCWMIANYGTGPQQARYLPEAVGLGGPGCWHFRRAARSSGRRPDRPAHPHCQQAEVSRST
jgi:alkylation response protein AidB-like acyl-CoA dehydrogenase